MAFYFDYADQQDPQSGLGIYDGDHLPGARPVLVLSFENMESIILDYYKLRDFKTFRDSRPVLTVVGDE
jgi:hypothetical protein